VPVGLKTESPEWLERFEPTLGAVMDLEEELSQG
jgi:hypothetical protein